MTRLQRQSARVAAQRFRLVYDLLVHGRREATRHAEYERGSRSLEVADRSVRLEIAAHLHVSEHASGLLMLRAEAVMVDFPALLSALEAGRITEAHVSTLVDMLYQHRAEHHDQILSEGVALAESEQSGPFRRALKELSERLQTATLQQRCEDAVAERRVWFDIGTDATGGAMGSATIYAPAVEIQAIQNRVAAMAKALRNNPDDERTLAQLRADVLCDLLIDGETETLPVHVRGIRPTVTVTVPVLALLGGGVAAGYASVEGVGPIPLGRARELCGAASGWMRVLTHPETGVILSFGRQLYSPPAELKRLVRYRAGRCMAPGCEMPADRCEIDHTIAWHDGGETSAGNLAPLCKGHHTIKHHGRWKLRQVPASGGAVEWMSPHGRRYLVHPQRRMPTFTEAAPF